MPNRTSAPRHDGWTPAVRAAFLDALRQFGSVRHALAAVGKARSGAYSLKARDPLFAAAWDDSLAEAALPVTTRLIDRAIGGEWVRIVDETGKELSAFHRVDSRFALSLLTRLERRAERRAALAAALSSGEPSVERRSGQRGQSGQSARQSHSPFPDAP